MAIRFDTLDRMKQFAAKRKEKLSAARRFESEVGGGDLPGRNENRMHDDIRARRRQVNNLEGIFSRRDIGDGKAAIVVGDSGVGMFKRDDDACFPGMN
jgi:hypothetical protein